MLDNTVKMFGISIDNLTMEEAIKKIDSIIRNAKPSYIVTPNVDHIVQLQYDKEFKEIYDNASMVLADGMPLIWASALLKKKLVERVTGADLVPEIMKLAEQKNYRVFILGGDKGVAEKAIEKTLKNTSRPFPMSSYSPPMGFEKDVTELEKIKKLIKEFQPDILLVSLGSPKGEKWISNNFKELQIPFSASIGAAIDFLAGTKKRAPLWMQKIGLEWFYRFLQEPKRMFKRYFIRDSKFIFLLLRELMKNKNTKERIIK